VAGGEGRGRFESTQAMGGDRSSAVRQNASSYEAQQSREECQRKNWCWEAQCLALGSEGSQTHREKVTGGIQKKGEG